jgi:replication factor A1
MQNDRIKIIDFVGVLICAGPVSDIQLKSGEVKKKRSIVVCDKSSMTIECQVWAEVSELFEGLTDQYPVIAFKGVRVTNFNGLGLTMDTDASLEFNPNLP